MTWSHPHQQKFIMRFEVSRLRELCWLEGGAECLTHLSITVTLSVCLCMQKAADSAFLWLSYFALSCSFTYSTVQKYWPPLPSQYFLHMSARYNTKLFCNFFRISSSSFLKDLLQALKLFYRHWIYFVPIYAEMLSSAETWRAVPQESLAFWKQETIGVSQSIQRTWPVHSNDFYTSKSLNRLLETFVVDLAPIL